MASGQQYVFRHLIPSDGLSSNYIYGLLKDLDGFMWFATGNGLDRFDGYNIISYKHFENDSNSLSDNVVLSLAELDNDNLLVGTAKGGLNVLNKPADRFINFSNIPGDSTSLSNDRVNVILKDYEGLIWLGTSGGLNLFYLDSGKFKVFMQDCPIDENRCNQVYSLFRDSRGNLWVGTNAGLFRFDLSDRSFTAVNLDVSPEFKDPIIQVNGLDEDPFGVLWIGTNLGLFKYDIEENELIGPPYIHLGPLTEDIEFIHDGNDNYAWISTHWGLYKYDFQLNRYDTLYSFPGCGECLSDQAMMDLLYDERGILWIVTSSNGIDFMKPSESFFHQHSIEIFNGKELLKCSARAFFEDADGDLWVGSHIAGVVKFDRDLELFSRKDFRFSDNTYYTGGRVVKILRDNGGVLWVCVANPKPSVCIFDEKNEVFRLIDTSEMIHSWMFPPRYTTDMIEDRDGNKWISSYTGLGWMPRSETANYNVLLVNHPVLSEKAVLDLHEDLMGVIWAASPDGLFAINRSDKDILEFKEYYLYEAGHRLRDVSPRCVYTGIDERTWAGTSLGLFRLDERSSHFIPVSSGSILLHDNIIHSIIGDHNGNLWLASDKGLIRFSPENGRVKLFDRDDGLPYEGSIFDELYYSPSGKIFVTAKYGSQNGFYWFYPDSIKDNTHLLNVFLTDFKVRNNPFLLDSNISYIHEIRLKHYQNYLSFEYAALDYQSPGKNQYAHRLEGLDDDWVYVGDRRYANYTGIPPGEYTFRVKGSNNDGYWSEEGTGIRIKILLPPWKTWWAYMGYAFFVAGIFILWRWYDLRRIRLKQQLELERVEATKLKELDIMKSRFFANISHEFRTPLMLILGPLEKLISKSKDEEQAGELKVMKRNASRLQRLINQLLDLSRIESGKMKLRASETDLVPFVNNYIQLFESLANNKNIDLVFSALENKASVWIDREKMQQVLNNLLSNALKFTPNGGRVAVSVGQLDSWTIGRKERIKHEILSNFLPPTANLSENCTVISVADTGSGIAPGHLAHIFDRFYQADDSYTKDQEGTGIGLELIKELVELHHGEIHVESEIGKGTTFFILLPQGREHLKEEEIVSTRHPEPREGQQPVPESEAISGSLVVSSQSEFSNLENEEMKSSIVDPPPSITHDNDTSPIVLLVEDNPDMRNFIREYLDDGCLVLEAENGEEGLVKATENIPDLIITDVMMPKMDGYEFCREIKQNVNTCHIPVILLTARASMESKIEGLETGADDFIIKPFDPQELLVRMKNLIDQRKRWQEQFLRKFHRSDFNPFPQLLEASITSLDEKFLQKASKVVEEHIDDAEFSVEKFVAEMAMSQVQLYRKLKALLGLSAIEFIRSIRLNRAARMIEKKSGNIAQVSFAVGFNNPSYFAECFRKQFGVSPSEYSKTGGLAH